MALNLSNKYPGRANPPSIDYPEGSIKNQTAPGAKDGTPLDADWANDKEGFFQSLLSKAGVVANGSVDKAGDSQYFNALISGNRATDEDTQAGIIDDKFVTPKKLLFGFILGSNYIIFPKFLGGFVIQGAAVTTSSGPVATVNFPIAFPNSTWGVVVNNQNLNINTPRAVMTTDGSADPKTAFHVRCADSTGPFGISYVAWGR